MCTSLVSIWHSLQVNKKWFLHLRCYSASMKGGRTNGVQNMAEEKKKKVFLEIRKVICRSYRSQVCPTWLLKGLCRKGNTYWKEAIEVGL